jgi:hypothetical protein
VGSSVVYTTVKKSPFHWKFVEVVRPFVLVVKKEIPGNRTLAHELLKAKFLAVTLHTKVNVSRNGASRNFSKEFLLVFDLTDCCGLLLEI